MTAATPGQAAHRADGLSKGLSEESIRRNWEGAHFKYQQLWEDIAQAAIAITATLPENVKQALIDAAAEGSLRACGYTLADVGRFLEAEAAAQDARPAPDLEIAAIIAERNQLRMALKRLADEGSLLARERLAAIGEARVTEARPAPELATVTALAKVAEAHERVIFAALIDIRRGDPGAAGRLLGEHLGVWNGAPRDGTETGAQYLERGRDGE